LGLRNIDSRFEISDATTFVHASPHLLYFSNWITTSNLEAETGSNRGSSQQETRSRFYQLKMGHCFIGQYLQWTMRRPDAKCCQWCQYKTQTREHRFNCPPAETLWATILEEIRRHPFPVRTRDRTKIAELFADERCSPGHPRLPRGNGYRQDGSPPVTAVQEGAGGEGGQRT